MIRTHSKYRGHSIVAALMLLISPVISDAALLFDPINQPIGSVGSYTLTKPGLADGQAKIFRPYFNDVAWWGDLESFNVDPQGGIRDANNQLMTSAVTAYVPNWSARTLLDARDYTTRKILSRRNDNGNPVLFQTITDFSASQQIDLESQNLLNFIRGDRSNEDGVAFRQRPTLLGDIVHSTPMYIEYDPVTLANNRVIVGANDGMVHIFNASTGAEEFAYIPSTVIPNLATLKLPTYADGHRYYVNGDMVADDITFSDDTNHKVLVGGLGAGGQAYYALDISDTDVSTDAKLAGKLLWEISDKSPGMSNLGYSYGQPLLAQVRVGNSTVWAAIFGNGYSNTLDDGTMGSGQASLFIVNAQTGQLIREINTLSGSVASPNGLSGPAAADIDDDNIIDYVYAGDLDGNIWKFDFTGNAANWDVSYAGVPFTSLSSADATPQPITTAPYLLKHPDGGLLILTATGRMLTTNDPSDSQVQSIYGLRDRMNDVPLAINTDVVTGNVVVQDLTEGSYSFGGTTLTIRTSSNEPITNANEGWVVDLTGGERVLSPIQIRSGHLLFSSINPTLIDPTDPLNQRGGEVWVNELDILSGGAPSNIIFDMNEDGVLDETDNIDGNSDGDLVDPEDRITGLLQGYGIVLSSPTVAILDSTTGTFFVNRLHHSETLPTVTPPAGPGLAGGHFDVDTSSSISPINTGSTDAHVHQYDDKYNVTGVDYFGFLEAKLHEINEDISLLLQKFKLIVVNADKSPGGRLVINQAYNENNISSYTSVTSYDNTAIGSLPIYTLGTSGTATKLDQLGIYFDVNAILNRELIPTQTGCVRDNILSSDGEWRNGALTLWAVKVNDDGSDAFTLDRDPSNGNITGITSGLLWESTLFWHWEGPCAHEYTSLDSLYLDAGGSTVVNQTTGQNYTVFDFYKEKTLLKQDKDKKKKDKRKGKKKKEKDEKDKDKDEDEDDNNDGDNNNTGGTGGTGGTTPSADNTTTLDTLSPPAWLSNPFRVSWSEL